MSTPTGINIFNEYNETISVSGSSNGITNIPKNPSNTVDNPTAVEIDFNGTNTVVLTIPLVVTAPPESAHPNFTILNVMDSSGSGCTVSITPKALIAEVGTGKPDMTIGKDGIPIGQ